MISAPHPGSLVTQTRRHAVKVGDEYITLESTVALPLDASETEIAAAVELGMRINAAQEAAFTDQIAALRLSAHMASADEPVSDKQRGYLQYLQQELGWTEERLAAFAATRDLDLAALTKDQASALIDALKRMVSGDAPVAPAAPTHRPDIRDEERATARQLRALEHAAQSGRFNPVAACQRFQVRDLALLSMDEAGHLLAACQAVTPAGPAAAPATRQPDPQRLQTARAALAGAEQRAQRFAPTGRVVPQGTPPASAATPGQLGKIAGQMHELRQAGTPDAEINAIGTPFAVPQLSQLRKSEQLQILQLTKADAGQIIDALKGALAEFGVAQV